MTRNKSMYSIDVFRVGLVESMDVDPVETRLNVSESLKTSQDHIGKRRDRP